MCRVEWSRECYLGERTKKEREGKRERVREKSQWRIAEIQYGRERKWDKMAGSVSWKGERERERLTLIYLEHKHDS